MNIIFRMQSLETAIVTKKIISVDLDVTCKKMTKNKAQCVPLERWGL